MWSRSILRVGYWSSSSSLSLFLQAVCNLIWCTMLNWLYLFSSSTGRTWFCFILGQWMSISFLTISRHFCRVYVIIYFFWYLLHHCRSDSAPFSVPPQIVCILLKLLMVHNVVLTLPCSHCSNRKYVILWQCPSDSAVFSLLSQIVCGSDHLWMPSQYNTDVTMLWSPPNPQIVCDLVHYRQNVDLTQLFFLRSNRMYVILFDPWTTWMLTDSASSSPLQQEVCDLVWFPHNVDLTLPCFTHRMYVISFEYLRITNVTLLRCRRAHRTYVIWFDSLTMSFWLYVLLATRAGRMWCCLMTAQCWCASDSFPPPQSVCHFVLSLENDVDLTLHHRRSHRGYVILFDACTMSIWLCLVIAYLTEYGTLYCLIPGQCQWSDSASSSPIPQGVCYTVWCLDNIDLTLPCHLRSHSLQKVCYLVWSLDNVDLTLLHHHRSHRKYVYCLIAGQCRSDSASSLSLKQDVCYIVWWTISIWLWLVITTHWHTGRMSYCLIPGQCVDLTLPRHHPHTGRMLFYLISGWCRSDSASSSPFPQDVCYTSIVLLNAYNTDVMWLFAAPTERMSSCVIPGKSRSDSVHQEKPNFLTALIQSY